MCLNRSQSVSPGSGRSKGTRLSLFQSGAGSQNRKAHPGYSFYQTNRTPNGSPGLLGSLKALIRRLRLLRGDRDFLILLAQFFVDEGNRVIARREALNLILS
jgi:hypothetical protein